MFSEFCSISALSCSFEFVWWVGGGWFPSDYLVSTQLQLWLFCCWGCGCCWAVTISHLLIKQIVSNHLVSKVWLFAYFKIIYYFRQIVSKHLVAKLGLSDFFKIIYHFRQIVSKHLLAKLGLSDYVKKFSMKDENPSLNSRLQNLFFPSAFISLHN